MSIPYGTDHNTPDFWECTCGAVHSGRGPHIWRVDRLARRAVAAVVQVVAR